MRVPILAEWGWSHDAQLLWRPFAGYRALAATPAGARAALLGLFRWCVVIACFVSLTTAGRLLLDHLLFAPLGWAFAPVAQTLCVIATARVVKAKLPTTKLLELYFAGHAPWFVLLVLIAGVCLFAPEPQLALRFFVGTGIGFALVLAAIVWCCFLTYAMFRTGVGLGRGAAALASALFYVGYAGTLVGYFLVTGQLLPLFGRFS
ncbi:MAG TPA: hypothetical protein VFB62_24385 [Polyangiaceae bacterium]|jgi:hypothetical protein|nr:hypothetical protein [Polyangiaceae bacterium]